MNGTCKTGTVQQTVQLQKVLRVLVQRFLMTAVASVQQQAHLCRKQWALQHESAGLSWLVDTLKCKVTTNKTQSGVDLHMSMLAPEAQELCQSGIPQNISICADWLPGHTQLVQLLHSTWRQKTCRQNQAVKPVPLPRFSQASDTENLQAERPMNLVLPPRHHEQVTQKTAGKAGCEACVATKQNMKLDYELANFDLVSTTG